MYFIIFGIIFILGIFGGTVCTVWWLTRMPHKGFMWISRTILIKRIENIKEGKISDVK